MRVVVDSVNQHRKRTFSRYSDNSNNNKRRQASRKNLLEGFIIIIVIRGGDKTIEAFRVVIIRGERQARASLLEVYCYWRCK